MDFLKPLTISNSVGSEPTKLLTKDFSVYLLFKPINLHTSMQVTLLNYLLNHFKVNAVKPAYFDYKDKRYLCFEEIRGAHTFSTFYQYLWTNKKSYNYFFNPEELLKIGLVNLFFPLFNAPVNTTIVNHRKYLLTASFDSISFSDPIRFSPFSIHQLGLSSPAVKKFIAYKKRTMNELVEAFQILHHDKLAADLKYQVSMNNELRNHYWNEMQKCLSNDYKNYVLSVMKDYLLRI